MGRLLMSYFRRSGYEVTLPLSMIPGKGIPRAERRVANVIEPVDFVLVSNIFLSAALIVLVVFLLDDEGADAPRSLLAAAAAVDEEV
eukprot:CAMPEP_0204624026 /NCGR_PEP_ID=MMETSP0717-20131115/9796_1 /ASSEMBLY_ACC=CAM_ASM_000666 /TAXON_ID=230516 /ORGANISM="Chaetoceros curvisetus" /LENGTH=86 /DNA_ID=CAMNT_0051639295 /DNA_START=71 /DNA_END=328 /DNA_ORIENTATION=+